MKRPRSPPPRAGPTVGAGAAFVAARGARNEKRHDDADKVDKRNNRQKMAPSGTIEAGSRLTLTAAAGRRKTRAGAPSINSSSSPSRPAAAA